MIVYFGTSPRIKKDYPQAVKAIFKQVEKLGYQHVSEWISRVNPDRFYQASLKDQKKHFEDTVAGIRKADVCLFEASERSFSVGYWVNYALGMGKPTIVLSQKERNSFLVKQINPDRFFFVVYHRGNLASKLEETLEKAAQKIDLRFNFFLSSNLLAYLDWAAQKKGVPRSVYLRQLIAQDMKNNRDYPPKE
ncbi:MAG: hypothetical protein PHR64_01600 [Candidatus Shapirobacteria bacterium]|nr:hypothetical protein [Candidatus Shapirobacteria bacterium]MDD5073774.1 hypothetical protein [Candidatus Shapirobacteria bacterium]MDD5481625.1 hypothetical protein [Candidatus Shapirobacteria bacterium]